MGASDIEDIYRLTLTQQGMLFECLVADDPDLYVAQVSTVVPGDVDDDALTRAAGLVASRHAALRTSFVWEGVPEPVQVVHREADLPVTFHDVTGLAEPERHAAVDSALRIEREKLDLQYGPLSRLAVVREAEGVTRLTATFHHLVVDRWSSDIVLAEIGEAYRAYKGGGPSEPRLAPPGPQFRDYVAWIAQQDTAEAEKHWRRALQGVGNATPAPGAGRRDGTGTGVLHLPLAEELHQYLAQAARREGLTLFTLVEGAWALLLAATAERHDVIFGVNVSGRPVDLPGADSIVGMLVNTVPVRVRVDPGAEVVAWLRSLQESQLDQRRFEHVPLPSIRRWSDVPPGSPMFESVLAFQNQPASRSRDIRGSTLSAVEPTTSPLNVYVERSATASTLWLSFHRARYDLEVVQQVAYRLRHVLASIATTIGSDPAAPLRSIDVPMPPPGTVSSARRPTAPVPVEAPEAPAPFMAPTKETEVVLATIWAEVLGTGPVGVDDDFFLLGGDSIHSLHIVSRAGHKGIRLRPRDVFDHPTVRARGAAPPAGAD